jgi:hypothetical protein
MPRWCAAPLRSAAVAAASVLLAGCGLGQTPERASIVTVEAVAGGTALDVTQRLVLSPTMLEALDRGIPLRLAYRIDWCAAAGREPEARVLQLRYLPLGRQYELRPLPDGDALRFARRSALLASLDRVRLPLQLAAPDCGGSVSVALDLTALPTPLRFPAFLEPTAWRLVSPAYAWPSAQG